MSSDEEFKNSSIFISNIADIVNEFKKFESLPQKIKNNNNEITILQEEIVGRGIKCVKFDFMLQD